MPIWLQITLGCLTGILTIFQIFEIFWMEKKDKQIKNISQNNNISGSGNNLIQNTETMNNYGITPDILTTILTVSIPEVIKNFEHNNMSSIVNGAKAELTDSKYDTSSVNLDWQYSFVRNAADVTNDELQKIWSHILAAEIKKPNSISLKTLETLKSLSPISARLFKRILSSSFGDSGLMKFNEENDRYTFMDLAALDDAGLIDRSNVYITKEIIPHEKIDFQSHKYMVVIENISDKDKVKFLFPIYRFTSVGKELYNIEEKNIDSDEAAFEYATALKQNNKNNKNIRIMCYIKKYISSKHFSYDTSKDLLNQEETK